MPEEEKQTTKQPTIKWQKDPLREQLKKDILDGTIKSDIKPDLAQKLCIEYKNMDGTFCWSTPWHAQIHYERS